LTPLRRLAGQTAIYGLPSIVGRVLNYLLVPLHTAIFVPEQFGIITEMYSYVAFLVVLLTFGMETAYFRFASKEQYNKKEVFGTVASLLAITTGLFIFVAVCFSTTIANFLRYPDNSEYVIWFAIIVGLDALSSIPLARLRLEERPMRFAMINFSSILTNIGLNVFFVGYLIHAGQHGVDNWFVRAFYREDIGVGYVFLANLIASIVKFLLLTPALLSAKLAIRRHIIYAMAIYGLPLLISNLAGIVNETADKIMLKRMLLDDLGEVGANEQLGIYGACYKISIIVTLFVQAFRYAAEPFFFSEEKNKDAASSYARVMKYFVIVVTTIFLGVMLYLDIIKHFIRQESFWVGLGVVPVLLLANICLGIFYNLSVWYKLSGKTQYGAYIAIFGAALTLVLNYWWIPLYGYMGSAWATLCCYFSMAVLSYFLGQRFYPIRYPLKQIAAYLTLGLLLYFTSTQLTPSSEWLKYSLHTLLLLLFLGVVYLQERTKKVIT
jgi:O-antigen/teichoic acid export membrane protein